MYFELSYDQNAINLIIDKMTYFLAKYVRVII